MHRAAFFITYSYYTYQYTCRIYYFDTLACFIHCTIHACPIQLLTNTPGLKKRVSSPSVCWLWIGIRFARTILKALCMLLDILGFCLQFFLSYFAMSYNFMLTSCWCLLLFCLCLWEQENVFMDDFAIKVYLTIFLILRRSNFSHIYKCEFCKLYFSCMDISNSASAKVIVT